MKRWPEVQPKAIGNGPGRADCERRRTDTDRRDSCGSHDNEQRLILAIDEHMLTHVQLLPTRVVCSDLLAFAGSGVI